MSQDSNRSTAGNSHLLLPRDSDLNGSPDYAGNLDSMVRIRRWGLALADAAGISAGIAAAAVFGKIGSENLIWGVLAIPMWIFVAKLYNLYDRDHRRITHATSDEIPALIATAAITLVLVKLISEVFASGLLPSSALVIAGSTSVFFIIALRSVVRRAYFKIADRERTIIVGTGPKAALVARRLRSQARKQIDLLGYVSSNGGDEGGDPLSDIELERLGDTGELGSAIGRNRISRVVIADDDLSARKTGKVINVCRQSQVSVTLVPANQEVLGPGTELNRMAGVPMLDFHFSVPPRSTLAIKRVIDLVFAVVILVLTSPLLALSAVAIKLDSKGPVFFRQVRVGKDGRQFKIFKLRTMVVDAEERLDELIDLDALEEPAFKIENDPRVTRVGSILRRTSLDELPQFINVLRGEMSMVGPRPEEVAVVALYDERQRERLAVKPGLTGPMQVAGRGDLGFEERLAMERDYLDNLTITGDISILIRTPRAVIKGHGAF